MHLEVGTYKDREHYAIIGRPNDFYVWIREHGEHGESSKWIVGREAFAIHLRARKLLEDRKKNEFIALIRELFKKYGPMRY